MARGGILYPRRVVAPPTGVTQISGLSHHFGLPWSMDKRPVILVASRVAPRTRGSMQRN
jgi:hypothetical protein